MPNGYSLDGIGVLGQILAQRGINPAAASGAISGIMGESGANLDPHSFNTKDPGGGSGGIGQWNRERLVGPNGMLAFARAQGIPVDTNSPTDARKVPFAIQAQYLGHELDTTYSGVARALKGAQSPQDALRIWVNQYENPADKTGAIAQRSQYLTPVASALGGAQGTTLTSPGIMDPSIVARGGVSSPSPTGESVAAPSSPSLMSNLQKGDVGAIFNQLATGKKDAQGNEQPGTSALSKLAGLTKGKEAPAQAPSAPMLQGMGDSTPAIAPAAQQLLSQTFANAAKPLSWSMLPYGSDAGPQGLTLNSGAQNV